MSPIGPHLPSIIPGKRKRDDNGEEDDSDGSSTGPVPANQVTRTPTSPLTDTKKRRAIGPQLPPSSGQPTSSENKPQEGKRDATIPVTNQEDDSSDDDDFGPSLPPLPSVSGASGNPNTRLTDPDGITNLAASKTATGRDAWMLLPPAGTDWSTSASAMDPTMLKSRKFNTSKPGKAPPSKTDLGAASIWNETPAEKIARLQREVLGIATAAPTSKHHSVNSSNPAADAADASAEQLRRKIATARGPSLYDSHTAKDSNDSTSGSSSKPKEEEDDPSARAFDREKDMATGLRIDSTQRREILAKSREGISSRFGNAKYL